MQCTRLMSIAILALAVILVALLLSAGAWAASKERVLYSFKNDGKDGMAPTAGLIFDTAGNLYGTTVTGGIVTGFCLSGCGTVFELTPAAHGKRIEKVLHRFKSGPDGYSPQAGVILDGAGNLYGTTEKGGGGNNPGGTAFELTRGTGGWTIKVLHTFGFGKGGINPFGSLIFDAAGNLYGTTSNGGGHQRGTVFELMPGTTGYWTETVLHSFHGAKDGAVPQAGLILDATGNLYGTTSFLDGHDHGNVFELMPGTNGQWTETVLHPFTGRRDGYDPQASLILDATGNLYGTTLYGGHYGEGAVFELTPGANGQWTETVVHSFSNKAGTDGAKPQAGLILGKAGKLYGTTSEGGANGLGTVFELTP
jgi:uncharacterized repeat protein (TIGR03803 family)